ncbi:probable tRNA N6-adenosine threonylcarbamoyltransferase, mitochondrial [Sabethes cyaneus]|uniref:probable tRNA N6-adenosine threonylcarbamoyltransferase, mitochondrial n=1 Tax=Sabethes cyaneus TaxID=53552 RepID=UPI00237DA124|nr:probable tRNA N6-adenosine threonylcarbamoyltransferase, mitochondrial [Sabethes cyaneus]
MFPCGSLLICRSIQAWSWIISVSNSHIRPCHNNAQRPFILGIETSCDDSASAIVSSDGQILGEYIHSQQISHLRFGGIIPPVAQDFHRKHIENVVSQTFKNANLSCNEIDAIAVTNRPGLPLSLLVGVRYAKFLARKHNKPIIPIHHMQAHALMARMTSDIPYPYLCILLSGGHALLTLVKSACEFYLLGQTLDDAPGEALDKIARRLKLRNLPRYNCISGGAAIELAAARGQVSAKYPFPLPLSQYRDCQFSFAGLKNAATRQIALEEQFLDLAPDAVLPDYENFCANYLNAVTRHISQRAKRAMLFVEKESLIHPKDQKILVISGGVARNDAIFNGVSEMASTMSFKTVRPEKNLCNDNGTMIAWNGMETFLEQRNLTVSYDNIDIFSKASIGFDMIEKVKNKNISTK